MNAEQSWWLDLLKEGVLPTTYGLKEANVSPCEALHGRYVEHARKQGVSYRSSQTKLGMFLQKQLGDGVQRYRPTVKHELPGWAPVGAEAAPPARPWCYRLPSLKECRERFVAKLGQHVEWGEDWEKETWAYEVYRI